MLLSGPFFILSILAATEARQRTLPKNLRFGASTSAYQIEGAWNEDGKGESIWDHYFHSGKSRSKKNGDVACDSYHRYKEDIQLAAKLGLKFFRFSIAWTRILPTGYSNNINQKGIDHYKNVVAEMLKYNMTPVATLYHWDLPQQLYVDGLHWNNPDFVPYFVEYARIVIRSLPGVGVWITINEPREICYLGYGIGVNPPGINNDGIDDYLCAYTVIKAHAAVYHMYKSEFPDYKAKMSMCPDCEWIQPITNSTADIEAAKREIQFECGTYYHPIFKGDWPKVVKERIQKRSEEANLPKSRLPQFSKEEIEYIKGTHDYLGVNHYYTTFARDIPEAASNVVSYAADLRVEAVFDAAIPRGIYNVLKWFEEEYGKNEVFITEIGFGMPNANDTINDDVRVDYYADFTCNILKAIDDGVEIKGIMLWSLLDNIEWGYGDNVRFGLHRIDFDDPALTRKPKKSAKFINNLIKKRKLDCDNWRRNWLTIPVGVSTNSMRK